MCWRIWIKGEEEEEVRLEWMGYLYGIRVPLYLPCRLRGHYLPEISPHSRIAHSYLDDGLSTPACASSCGQVSRVHRRPSPRQ